MVFIRIYKLLCSVDVYYFPMLAYNVYFKESSNECYTFVGVICIDVLFESI